jgi:gamma-glutamyltranspeptidase/glutathione hydrolase
MAKEGVEDFYKGRIAQRIHDDMQANGGLIQADDLAQIPWPVERRPLATHFGHHRVFTFGPPGAGRALVEALNILSQFPEKERDPDTPRGALLLTRVIQKANLDRADRPEDPSLYPQELELGKDIINLKYAQRVASRIRSRLRTRGETTHLSAIDREGNVVGLTQSIERIFGSFAASPELGFLYNNYMSAFEYQDISHPYYLRPNAVPWASVAPTIVQRGRRPWLVIGSPGSERIVSAILQVLLRLERGATPFDAVQAPRLHCSLKGKASLEATRMRDDIPAILSRNGFEIDVRDPYSFYLGCIQLVVRGRKGELVGVADPRRDGSAGGP